MGVGVAVARRPSAGYTFNRRYDTAKTVKVNRGDVWMVALDGAKGSEQSGVRPCLVISNQLGNRYGSTVIVAAISSQVHKAKMPTHVLLEASKHGLDMDSFVMLEQVRTVDKSRLIEYCTTITDQNVMKDVAKAHMISCTDTFS